MAKVKVDEKSTVTRAELAKVLGVSRTQIGNLVNEGLPSRGSEYPLIEAVRWYIDRESREEGESKARLLSAKAKLEELKLARELSQTITVDAVMEEIEPLLNLRSQLLTVPKKVAPILKDGLTAGEREAIITRSIHDALKELASLPERLKDISPSVEEENTEVNS